MPAPSPAAHEKSREALGEDYLRWHAAQVRSRDLDPMYPVLLDLAESWGLDEDDRVWLGFLHVVWYQPGSTLAAFDRVPSLRDLPGDEDGLRRLGLLDLPCETERRGHRTTSALVKHLLSLRETLSERGPFEWVMDHALRPGDAREGWLAVNEALTGVYGNGRWAAYKTAEILQKVCDVPIEAADAGHRYSTGPRKGLALIEPESVDADIEMLDFLTGLWADRLGEPDIAQVETSLCDFNSLYRGRYYLGHDIDSMAAGLLHPRVVGHVDPEVWAARERSFNPVFLRRSDVDRDANRHYRNTGEMLYV